MSNMAEKKTVLNNLNIRGGISSKEFEEMFPKVEVSKISLEDVFMEYIPETKNQKRVKKSIITAKNNGLKDFRKPKMDPSFSDNGINIGYEEGREPAIGKSPIWWEKTCKNFMPEKNSRLGNHIHYDVFLGTIIKYLVEERGYNVSDAWYTVCNDGKKLAYYGNLDDRNNEFKKTGSEPISKWYDIANTYKIITSELYGFFLAGTEWDSVSHNDSFATLYGVYHPSLEYFSSVGWMIMDI